MEPHQVLDCLQLAVDDGLDVLVVLPRQQDVPDALHLLVKVQEKVGAAKVARVLRANGSERIEFVGGSRIRVVGRGRMRGVTADAVLLVGFGCDHDLYEDAMVVACGTGRSGRVVSYVAA